MVLGQPCRDASHCLLLPGVGKEVEDGSGGGFSQDVDFETHSDGFEGHEELLERSIVAPVLDHGLVDGQLS